MIYLLEIIVIISFTALIFSGELSNQLPFALGFVIIGDAILCAIISLLSNFPGSVAVGQDAPVAVQALVAAAILAALPPGAGPAQQFSTVVMMIVGTSLFTGLFLFLLGVFKLGGFARFLPYPVMGGFLAGTGWLLATGGIGMMANTSTGLGLFQPDKFLYWLPGLMLAIAMLLVVNRSNNPLWLPGLFGIGTLLFYGIARLANISITQLTAGGWLLGPLPSGSLWHFPLSAETLRLTDWQVLLAQAPSLAPILLISVIAMLLNANGLELVARKDIRVNHELVITGLANMSVSLVAGLVGYHALSLSTLNFKVGGSRRLSGLIVACLVGLTAFLGASLLNFIPKMILGALLVFLGLSLLVEWVFTAWLKFPKVDFLIVLLILGWIAVRGFMEGIAIGLIVTIVLFVVNYSQVNIIKHALTGMTYSSRVTRSSFQQEILRAHGRELHILILQGYIFFGTATGLLEKVRALTKQAELQVTRFVLLDFTQVTGLDSTGLLSFSKMLQIFEKNKIVLVITGLNGKIREQFTRESFYEKPGLLLFFSDLDHGVECCENQILADEQKESQLNKTLQDYLETFLPSPAKVEKLISHMNRRKFTPGEYLIQQGDDPELIFFIESGQVTAQLETPGQEPKRLETMSGGRVVGEIGFILGVRRTAAVVADEESVIYCLSKSKLVQTRKTDPEIEIILHQIIVHILGERVVHLTNIVNALHP